jgi:hypothetical protein
MEMGAVVDRVKLVHMGCGHTERGFDEGGSEVACSAVVMAIYAQWNVVTKADKPNESLHGAHGTREVAGSGGSSGTSGLSLFSVKRCCLCAVRDKVRPTEGLAGSS